MDSIPNDRYLDPFSDGREEEMIVTLIHSVMEGKKKWIGMNLCLISASTDAEFCLSQEVVGSFCLSQEVGIEKVFESEQLLE